jgi:cytosine/adenosine deaminase-related metal-dependent hydrolase
MPGLINGHQHIYSTFARGMALDFNPNNFQEILDQLWWKIDGGLNHDNVYYSGIVSGVESVQNGITTVIDHHASGVGIIGSLEMIKRAVCDEVGLRGVFCFETSDRFDIEDCIQENLSFMDKYQTNKTAGLFGLHAAMSLSEGTLNRISECLGERSIHIHVAESLMDQDLSIERYGERVIERLNRHGLLTPKSLLAHCLYIDDNESAIIAKNKCYIVLNVTSNMNNGVGLPDHQLFEKHQIPLMMGNDGIAAGMTNEWLNMLYTMHHKDGTPTQFGYNQLLEMIRTTYTYASTILGCQLGRIETGYEADLIKLPYVAPTPIHQDNAFGHVLYGLAGSFRPMDVWIGGEQIVKAYRVSERLTDQYADAQTSARELWQRLQQSN